MTGPRRVGKSTRALLMLCGKNFACLNFDDNELLKNWDESRAEALFDEVYPGYEYLLLDEVRNVENWDVWVERLYRRGVNLVIMGSALFKRTATPSMSCPWESSPLVKFDSPQKKILYCQA